VLPKTKKMLPCQAMPNKADATVSTLQAVEFAVQGMASQSSLLFLSALHMQSLQASWPMYYTQSCRHTVITRMSPSVQEAPNNTGSLDKDWNRTLD